MLRGAATVLAVIAAVASAAAQRVPGIGGGPSPNVGPPLILRLDGMVATSREGAAGKGFAVESLGFLKSKTRRWLAVTDARTIGGDNALDGKDVLNAVAPFDPNLIVAGPEALVARVRDAVPGTPLRIDGLVSIGSRTYLLRDVGPPPTD
jgi:hypothetical protein